MSSAWSLCLPERCWAESFARCPDSRLTHGPHRALTAPRHPCGAHQCSQFHDGLIESPGCASPPGKEQLRRRPETLLECFPWGSRVKGPAEHPRHIGVDRRDWPLEGEARHRGGGVPAYARQAAQVFGIGRNDTGSLLDDFLGQAVQVSRPAIVAQPVPALPYAGRRCRSERLECRVAGQECSIEPLDPGYLSLLQHELGYHDVIRVPGPAPGKVPPVSPKPAEQISLKDPGLERWSGGAHALQRSGERQAR